MPVNETRLGVTPGNHVYRVLLAAFLVAASPVPAAVPTSDCLNATALDLDAEQLGYAGERQQVERFHLEVSAPGIVTLDVTAAGESRTLAALDLSRDGCGEPGEATILEQSPTHLVLGVRTPGTWFFRVVSREPGTPPGPYKLANRFIAARLVEESFSAAAPSTDRIDVTRFYAAGVVTKTDPVEIDPDPGTAAPPPPPTGNSSRTSPDPGLLATVAVLRGPGTAVFEQVIFYRGGCTLRNRDDHGDTTGCATSVALGQELVGEIDPTGAGHDDDVFELELTELVSLDVTTRGETDTFGVLYDRFGQRLAEDDDGAEGRNFRIVKVLTPGRYFVRVGGHGGARGTYELSVIARGR